MNKDQLRRDSPSPGASSSQQAVTKPPDEPASHPADRVAKPYTLAPMPVAPSGSLPPTSLEEPPSDLAPQRGFGKSRRTPQADTTFPKDENPKAPSAISRPRRPRPSKGSDGRSVSSEYTAPEGVVHPTALSSRRKGPLPLHLLIPTHATEAAGERQNQQGLTAHAGTPPRSPFNDSLSNMRQHTAAGQTAPGTHSDETTAGSRRKAHDEPRTPTSLMDKQETSSTCRAKRELIDRGHTDGTQSPYATPDRDSPSTPLHPTAHRGSSEHHKLAETHDLGGVERDWTPHDGSRSRSHSRKNHRSRQKSGSDQPAPSPDVSAADSQESPHRSAPAGRRELHGPSISSKGSGGSEKRAEAVPFRKCGMTYRGRPSGPRTALMSVRSRHFRCLLVGGAGLLAAVLTVTIFLIAVGRRGSVPKAAPTSCDTKDCVEHALRLLSRLNASVDPCHDFHDYVCGGPEYHQELEEYYYHDSTVRQHANELALALTMPLHTRATSRQSKAAVKVFRALNACSQRRADQTARPFVDFMRQRGLFWPLPARRKPKLLDVLDILLDLAVNWRMTLWFDFRCSYFDMEESRIIVLGDTELLPLFRMEQLSDLGVRAYKDVVREFELFLTGVTPATRVLVAQWLRFIGLAQTLDETDPARLLDAAGWMLAYAYLWTLNPALDVFPANGRVAASDGLTPNTLCLLAVHESYGLAQVVPLFQEAFPAEERARVEAVLNRTVETLVGMIRASPILSAQSKEEAVLKITAHAHRQLWPPQPFLHPEVFDSLYDQFPHYSDSFFATLLGSREALRLAMTNKYYESLMLARYRWRSGHVIYFYALNRLLLGLEAVFPPSYLRHGSHSMSYAGLGFQLARQLVRAVDMEGRKIDHAGRRNRWWNLEVKDHVCELFTMTGYKYEVVFNLFALDVAQAAMKAAAEADQSPQRLGPLKGLTTSQTFYASYCSHFCQDGESPESKFMCNVAMEAPGFGDAFSCSEPRRGFAGGCLLL